MIRCFFYVIFLGVTLISCSTTPTGDQVSVTGRFPALSGHMIYLDELEVSKSVSVDSMRIDPDGSFRFSIQMNEPGFFLLRSDPQNNILLLIEEADEPTLSSENTIFSEGYQVMGSSGSELLRDFEMFMQKQKIRLDSIAEVYYSARGSEYFLETKHELDVLYEKIVEDQRRYIEDFVHNNPGSLASLIVLNRKLGQVHVVDEEEDFVLFHRTDSALTMQYHGNKNVADHHRRVKEIRARIFDRRMAEEKVKPGKKAPDIVLPDTTGKMISLKSFTGKPAILCFWAGWNAPSRFDNRRLTELYPEFQRKGVQMLGISLDENAVVWKGAIKLDRLSWTQVSDLKGLDSQISNAYNLPQRLPYYYLLDEKLRIVSKHNELDSLLIELDKIIF
jgi:peroxiredoxin